jgi:hypothetical protein
MKPHKIKNVYEKYFQKSRVFLYPALSMRRGTSITPIETYVSWKEVMGRNVSKLDVRLMCLYHLRDDDEFLKFEEKKLINNPLFCDYFETEKKDKAVYMFNFEDYKEDWFHFLNGRYSKLSNSLKKSIMTFYGENKANYKLIDSYLNPSKYYDQYSDLLKVKKETLEKVVELCDKPNFEKECLTLKIEKTICDIQDL